MLNLTPSELSPVASPLAGFADITQDLATRGWAVRDDFISAEWAAELHEEQQLQAQRGQFRLAGIGRDSSYQWDVATRGDQILWLDHGNGLSAQRQYLDLLEQLRLAVNRDLFLGLHEQQTHAALYPPGSFYQRHLDSFRQGNRRALTTILYLNPRWHTRDGGALRLYLGSQAVEEHVDLMPQAGRLVTFLSEQFEHEVLPTRRLRASITSWFSRRPVQ